MGVPGLWSVSIYYLRKIRYIDDTFYHQLLQPAGVVHSLTSYTVEEGFQKNCAGTRALRVGIDVSIWIYHAKFAYAGENPELRAFFYRCCRQVVGRNITPVFVFDGPHRPAEKRGKPVIRGDHWWVNAIKTFVNALGFEWRQVCAHDIISLDLLFLLTMLG